MALAASQLLDATLQALALIQNTLMRPMTAQEDLVRGLEQMRELAAARGAGGEQT